MQHRRLLRWLPAVVAPVVVAGVVAVPLVAAATPPQLPHKSAQQVLQLVAKAKDLPGFSGVVEQRSNLGLPAVPALGNGRGTTTASTLDLLAGTHTAQVDVAGSTRSRVALHDPSAERDVIRNGRSVWLWDSKKSTATHVLATGTSQPLTTQGSLPTPAEVAQELLAKVDGTTRVSVERARQVADQGTYTLVLRPRTTATTIGSVRIAVDATTGLPLDVQVFARRASSPAFEVGFTSISYAVPAASTFAFTPPSDAKVTNRSVTPGDRPTHHAAESERRPITTGSGWSSIVTLPASAVPSDLATNSTAKQLTTNVPGGRVLHTALVNVLLTDDGRVLAGAVPVSRLESAAR